MTWPIVTLLSAVIASITILASFYLLLNHLGAKRMKEAERLAEEARLVAKEAAETIVTIHGRLAHVEAVVNAPRRAAR